MRTLARCRTSRIERNVLLLRTLEETPIGSACDRGELGILRTLWISATSLVSATLAYVRACAMAARLGPIIGHFIAVVVRPETLFWVVVASVRRDPAVEWPRNGQTEEYRRREVTCIIEEVERSGVGWGMGGKYKRQMKKDRG